MHRPASIRLLAAVMLMLSLILSPHTPAAAQDLGPAAQPAPARAIEQPGVATFEVDKTNNIGTDSDPCTPAPDDCSLRRAVTLANASPGNIVKFSPTVFPNTTSSPTIILGLPLPTITQTGTQVLANAGQVVKITYLVAGGPIFQLNADDIVLDGLTIYGGLGSDIEVFQGANRQITIKNMTIGETGTCPFGATPVGVNIGIASGQTPNDASAIYLHNNRIECHATSGISVNGGRNVHIGGSAGNQGNRIYRNSIGIRLQNNADQVKIAANEVMTSTLSGIQINNATNTLIGGSAAGRNFISANGNNGIAITGAQSTGNQVAANYIGVARDGRTAQPNGNATETTSNGIYISGDASQNSIGGLLRTDGNLIAGNTGNGVMIDEADGNTVLFNDIGFSSADGTRGIPNRRSGIKLSGANGNIIGPRGSQAPLPVAAEANFIWYNTEAGIQLVNSEANFINANSLRFNAKGVELINADRNQLYRAHIADSLVRSGIANSGYGIYEDLESSFNTWREISTNSNDRAAIFKASGAPAAPQILQATKTGPNTYQIKGTTTLSVTIDIYLGDTVDVDQEGVKFVGSTSTTNGNWTANVQIPANPPSLNFLAIQTNGANPSRSSSQFSKTFFTHTYLPLTSR